jgi:hypothetical protein
MLPQNRREKKGGGMRVKKDKGMSASVIAWHYIMLTLLDHMGQRGFENIDITATRKIHTCDES